VLWIASVSARKAKPGCSRIAFEVILHIEGTKKQHQTLIFDIGPGNTPAPVITIGFPADFYAGAKLLAGEKPINPKGYRPPRRLPTAACCSPQNAVNMD
jgi:hypothetical protein